MILSLESLNHGRRETRSGRNRNWESEDLKIEYQASVLRAVQDSKRVLLRETAVLPFPGPILSRMRTPGLGFR